MVHIATIHAILLDPRIFIELLYVELTSTSLSLAQRIIHKQSLRNCRQTCNISDPRAVLIGQRMIIGHEPCF